jgi:hypothetical protein
MQQTIVPLVIAERHPGVSVEVRQEVSQQLFDALFLLLLDGCLAPHVVDQKVCRVP